MTGSPDDREDGDLTRRLDTDRPDPLEPLLRPPTTCLATPPGAFHRIRRRAARRRRARAAMVAAAVAAVLGGVPYLVGAISTSGGDEVVVPTATRSRTGPGPHSPSPSTAPSATSPPAVPTPAHRPPGDPSPGTTGPSGRTVAPSRHTPGTSPMCTASQLTAALGGGDAGAGNLYRSLVLTNRASGACQVSGYPGLSLLDTDGKQIGVPAARDRRTYAPVVLQPGGSASVTIHTVNRQGVCLPTSAQLRIYPPGDTASLVIPGEVTNCDGRFSVTPFAAGTSGNPSA
ncbi:DUF4232 domain-containing protein [Streptomyces sp. NBC_00316]|uniref:DUF4232 domain-containing protein n=1 Tax=Streptomyces sp. NBC_00316 TaxID=2975710 RepID=UPI002E2C294A|nr:DUF4232 domain-containing protein [Streptomyces sp. NBC_00316]